MQAGEWGEEGFSAGGMVPMGSWGALRGVGRDGGNEGREGRGAINIKSRWLTGKNVRKLRDDGAIEKRRGALLRNLDRWQGSGGESGGEDQGEACTRSREVKRIHGVRGPTRLRWSWAGKFGPRVLMAGNRRTAGVGTSSHRASKANNEPTVGRKDANPTQSDGGSDPGDSRDPQGGGTAL